MSVLDYKRVRTGGVMQDDAFVVVFPSEFARQKLGMLAGNVRKILKTRGQGFESVGRDGDVVVVRANDPVFASAAINQLFGIERVAIARRTPPGMEPIVEGAAKLGGSLLLRGERFLVRVEGATRGFVPKDAEIAITSAIIEKKAGAGETAAPGSEGRFDKLLYTYVTEGSAYVCIFLDQGHGGVPNLSQGQETVCPVFDEVSGVSCIEAIKQGYGARIAAVYRKRSELGRLAKILNRVIQFHLKPEIELEFYRFEPGSGISGRHELQSSITHLCRIIAEENRISKMSLPVSSQLFSAGFVDSTSGFVGRSGLLLHLPLEGRGDDIRGMAEEYVLGKFFGRIRTYGGRFTDVSHARFASNAAAAAKTKRAITVRSGPNTLHDILDSLGDR